MKFIRKRIYIISFILIIVIIIGLVILKIMLQKSSNITMDIKNNDTLIPNDVNEDDSTNETYLEYVDIKGEVINPGMYIISDNARVMDIINIAGGLTENADITLINLARKVIDEMVIIIYSKEEVNRIKEDDTKTECICPVTIINNDVCINSSTNNTNSSNTTTKVSLNTASITELTTIPGIGESKAKAIIEYRDNNDGFKNIEELKNVDGIGEATYEKIKDYFSL